MLFIFHIDLITLALKISDFVVMCLIAGAQGGREGKGSFSDDFQSLRHNYSNTSSNYESSSREVNLKKHVNDVIYWLPFSLIYAITFKLIFFTSLIVFKDPDQPVEGKIDFLLFMFQLNLKIASP